MAQLHATAFAVGWSAATFEAMLADRAHLAHVLEARVGVEAFAISRIVLDEADLLSIVVAKARRGRGVGAMLLRTHLASLARAGAAQLFLEVESENASAIALYRRYGGMQIARRRGYYPAVAGGTARDALGMRIELAAHVVAPVPDG